MHIHIKDPDKTIRIITKTTLSFVICSGLILVLAQIKPFWVDEWRLLYNLKFKTPAALWGKLDYTQQFPRLFLEVIKGFTSLFDYSYFVLRLPSFMAATATIFCCYRLMNRIYGNRQLNKYLFVLITVSSYTFTKYLVQIKQYEMEILLSIVAIWQLLELLKLQNPSFNKGGYILLCTSFLVVPFFSYTYPIAAAPIFMVVFVQAIRLLKNNSFAGNRKKVLLMQWLPLCICMVSILVFYITDVSQLMADPDMHQYWGYRMINGGVTVKSVGVKLYNLFSEVGAGFIYEIIFGILGVASFVFAIYKTNLKQLFKKEYDTSDWLKLYSILLLLLTMVLIISGKLPVEPKFNAYTVSSIAIMIIYFIDHLRQNSSFKKPAIIISLILYAGLTGNIFITFITIFTKPEYSRRIAIYVNTENAIIMAQAKKMPIIITPEVAFPDDIRMDIPFIPTISASHVLQTFPAYKVNENIAVYAINDVAEISTYVKKLPPYITAVLAGDGQSFHIIRR